MKNGIQEGKSLTLTAPVGGVVSGGAYLIGGLLVVAVADAAAGENFVGCTEGVYEIAKENTTAVFAEGEVVFWDDGASQMDETAGGRFPVGTAVASAIATDATVKVKLKGFAVDAV